MHCNHVYYSLDRKKWSCHVSLMDVLSIYIFFSPIYIYIFFSPVLLILHHSHPLVICHSLVFLHFLFVGDIW